MSRYDIADYLAMAVETVSRALTTLKARGAITLGNSRHVRIIDRIALEHGATEPRERYSLAQNDRIDQMSACGIRGARDTLRHRGPSSH
jgi:CRP/FNR family transcriptional regulator, nitrogen fixation regulation protein